MHLFALDHEISALKDEYLRSRTCPNLTILVSLAWHLRERESSLALALADEAQFLIAQQTHLTEQSANYAARLSLLRGEIKWLEGDSGAASTLIEEALETFTVQGDSIGIGDCSWISSFLANTRGKPGECDGLLIQAESAYQKGGDRVRMAVATLRRIHNRAFSDVAAAQSWFDEVRPGLDGKNTPATATWIESVDAVLLTLKGFTARSTVALLKSYEAALASGQIRVAAVTAINIGINFGSINEANSAMKWQERALGLAREHSWRSLEATCLSYMGQSMVQLAKVDTGIELLNEALAYLPSGSDSQANAWSNLGKAALAKSDWRAALQWFEKAEAQYQRLNYAVHVLACQPGRVTAFMKLGEYERAFDLCCEGLAFANAQGLSQAAVEFLTTLGEINRCGYVPKDAAAKNWTTAKACFDEAYKVASSIQDFIVPVELLESLAAEYAKLGDGSKAYAFSLEAGKSRERLNLQEANNLTTAFQIKRETELLKREAEQQRNQREVEALRANDLAAANATLQHLGEIGREITASLEANDVVTALQHHVVSLLDAHSLIVFRVSPDGLHLVSAHAMEDGRQLTEVRIAMDDPVSLSARCARERREIVTNVDASANPIEQGTAATRSVMHAPLVAGQHLMGAMTIQSPNSNAYTERERAIFRSLCAYGAIALANADAQEKLLAQNRELDLLATTDRLTGLFNRRYLDQVLERELASAKRSGKVFSVIIVDIDFFKQVNDRHGHLAGDDVLSTFGKLLKSRVRDSDIAGRWGGEEFLVICPNTNLVDTHGFAESLRELVEHTEFPVVGSKTASFGVANFNTGDSIAALLARADEALYRAKGTGRNRVVSI